MAAVRTFTGSEDTEEMQKPDLAEQIVDKYSDTIYRAAMSCLGDPVEAEDVVSDVLERYMTAVNAPDISEEEYLRAWLIRTALNRCKDLRKSPSFTRRAPMPQDIPSEAPGDLALDVKRALDRLDPKYRTVVYLSYYEGYTDAQIGRILGVGRSTVATRLRRARAKLKPFLAGYGKENDT